MSLAGTSTATFVPFLRLPPELRYQIWTAALSDCITPAAVPYKSGGWWTLTVPVPGAQEHPNPMKTHEPTRRIGCVALPHVTLDIPIFFACREARAAALPWLQKQKGIRKQSINDRFATSYDYSRDILYIATADYEYFTYCAYDLYDVYNDDDSNQIPLNSTEKIAVHAEILDDAAHASTFGDMLNMHFDALKEIYMIIEPTKVLPPLLNVDDNTLHNRWEFVVLGDDGAELNGMSYWQKATRAEEIIRGQLEEPEDPRKSSLRVMPVEMREMEKIPLF